MIPVRKKARNVVICRHLPNRKLIIPNFYKTKNKIIFFWSQLNKFTIPHIVFFIPNHRSSLMKNRIFKNYSSTIGWNFTIICDAQITSCMSMSFVRVIFSINIEPWIIKVNCKWFFNIKSFCKLSYCFSNNIFSFFNNAIRAF